MEIEKNIPIPKSAKKRSQWDKQVRNWFKKIAKTNKPKTDEDLKEEYRQEIDALKKRAAEARNNSR